MLHVLEFRQKIKKLKEEGNGLFDQAKSENRDLNPTESQKLESINAGIDTLERDMDSYIKINHISEEELRNTEPHRPEPGGYSQLETAMAGPANDRSYRGMFHGGNKGKELDRGGFTGFNEFLTVMSSGKHEPRLEELRTMTGGSSTDGGYSVPTQYAAWLIDNSLEAEIIRPRARVYPMQSDTLKIPAWNDLDHTSGQTYGGITLVWLAENSSATRQTPKLRQIELKANKAGIYVAASRELAQDGINFESQLETAMRNGLGHGLDDAFINGSGAGQPLGILNAASIVTAEAEDGQDANTFLYENALHMEERLHPSCQMSAVWIANLTSYVQLSTMYLNVGVGGSAIKALTKQGSQYYLLDRPLFFTEKCPVLGDKGDVILVDLSLYAIGLRQEVAIDISNVPGWLTDTIDYRIILRADGQPVWNSAFTPKNGDSLSWAVVMEAR